MTLNYRIGIAIALMVCTLAACGPPITKYRRSTLAPSAVGAIGHQPLKEGQVDVAGTLQQSEVHKDSSPQPGDPALHVAESTALAHLRVGLSEKLSLGLQGQFIHAKFSSVSAVGTPPLAERAAWGLGPNIGLHLGDPDGLSVNTSLALTWFNSPWAEWELTRYDAQQPSYTLVRSGRETHRLYRVQVVPHWKINEVFGVFTGASLQNSLTNRSFDDEAASNSTVEAGNDAITSFLGVTGRTPGGLYATAQGMITSDERSEWLHFGMQLTLGFQY